MREEIRYMRVSSPADRSFSPLLSPKCGLPPLSPGKSRRTQPSSNAVFSSCTHSTRLPTQPRSLTPLASHLASLRAQILPLQGTLETRARKRLLAKALFRRYQYQLTGREVERLSERQMLAKARKAWGLRAARKCAVQMKQWLLDRRWENAKSAISYREHMAAYRIQRTWRRYRLIIAAKDALFIQNEAILCIQKHIRGFLARSCYRKLRLYGDIRLMDLQYRVIKRMTTTEYPVNRLFRYWMSNLVRKEPVPPPVPSPPAVTREEKAGKRGERRREERQIRARKVPVRKMSVVVPGVRRGRERVERK